jgi:hypothetical protein
LGSLMLLLLLAEPLATPPTRAPRVPIFQYPIPTPTFAE